MFDYDIALLLSIFDFFCTIFITKANVFFQTNKNKLCARPLQYASALLHRTLRPSTRYACGTKVVRRPACLASSSCGRHEYSQCTRQTDVRRASSLNAFALSGRRHIKRTNTINCASYSFQN